MKTDLARSEECEGLTAFTGVWPNTYCSANRQQLFEACLCQFELFEHEHLA